MKLQYWLRTDRPRPADHRVQLYARLTVPPDPARAELPTGVWLLPREWAGTKDAYAFVGLARAAETECRDTLDKLKADLQMAEADARGEVRRSEAPCVTAARIKDLLPLKWRPRAKELAPLTVAAAVAEYLAHREALRGTAGNEAGTLDSLHSYARGFLAWWGAAYKPSMAAGMVTAHHGRLFLDYLCAAGGAPAVTNQRLHLLSTCWRWHGERGRLHTNPFAGLRVARRAPRDIVWLEPADLRRVESTALASPYLIRARWLFCVACYTGLAWADLTAWLTGGRILRPDGAGRDWLVIRRRKTRHHGGDEVVIPLLTGARRWLDTPAEMAPQGKRGKQARGPLPGYERQRQNLHELEAAASLPVALTTHVARKTFGMLLLNDGVPIETVSKLLGHSSIAITQKHYARILTRKVASDLERAGLLPPPPAPHPLAPETWGRRADRAARFPDEEPWLG